MAAHTLDAIRATCLVAATWVPLFFLLAGMGLVVARAARSRADRPMDWFRCFWIGWALLLIVLQTCHLRLPVDWRPLVLVGAIGVLGLALHARELARLAVQVAPRNWLFCLVVLIVVLHVANLAIGPPLHMDAGFYHFTAIKWDETYAIVPGLGNLHRPLAINSAHFLYLALLDVGPWAGRSYHLANGLLIAAALAQAVAGVFLLYRRGREPAAHHVFLAFSAAALLSQCEVGRNVFNSAYTHLVSSPAPDLAVFVAGIALGAELMALACREGPSPEDDSLSMAAIAALAAAGAMVKVSFLPFAAAASLVALGVYARGQKAPARARALLVPAGIVLAAAVPWIIRSVILSGYVAYPYWRPSVPVDWRMPEDVVKREAQVVREDARWPSGVIATRVRLALPAAERHWLQWWPQAVYRTALWTIIVPLALTLLACALAVCWKAGGAYGWNGGWAPFLALAPPVWAIAFWFWAAPNPRFAGGTFWVLAAATVALATTRAGGRARRVGPYVAGGVAIALAVYMFMRVPWTRPGPDAGFDPVPTVGTQPYVTKSGLEVFVPVLARPGLLPNCWNAPLPCTPTPDARLRTRRKGDIRSGFTLRQDR